MDTRKGARGYKLAAELETSEIKNKIKKRHKINYNNKKQISKLTPY